MKRKLCLFGLTICFLMIGFTNGWASIGTRRLLSMNSQQQANLDEFSLWRMGITLQKEGCKEVSALCRVRFVQDRSYEPPQGRIFVEDDYNGLIKVDDKGYSGIWTLSEDKNDRKDGLWIWGLFEEPKYPFLYFYMDIYDSVILPSGEEEKFFEIPGNRLNFRFSHQREKGKGAVLSDGLMTYKLTELMNADPLGLGGQVNVGDEVEVGKVELRVVSPDSKENTSLS